MKNITHQVHLTLKDHNREVDIMVPPGLLPADEIDAVFISKGNGKRCLYSFSDYSEIATGLRRGGESFKKSDVTVCSDGIGNKPPPEIEPVSTVGDGCVGEVRVVINGVEQTLDYSRSACHRREPGWQYPGRVQRIQRDPTPGAVRERLRKFRAEGRNAGLCGCQQHQGTHERPDRPRGLPAMLT